MANIFNFSRSVYHNQLQKRVTVWVQRYDDSTIEILNVYDVLQSDIKEKLPSDVVDYLRDEATDLYAWIL
jgi:hypothetical protein